MRRWHRVDPRAREADDVYYDGFPRAARRIGLHVDALDRALGQERVVVRDEYGAASPPGRSAGSRRHAGTHALHRGAAPHAARSEEHTSELQSREKLVCRLLLEKKKNNQQ